ncbi:MAG TPA: heterodisulfide reductase subunit C [Methanosarcinales archaeon]|nr:heterodisulfide reductase subunit C [Methanosarcinales archaeon]
MGIIIKEESRNKDFTSEVLNSIDSKILTCMQCGNCAGSCPTSSSMDYTPRQIIRMIQLGLKQEILSSNTIWLCASCYSCTVRCPRDIKITEVMNALRRLAISEGVENYSVTFDKAFIEVLKKYGRMFELQVGLKSNLSNPKRLIQQTPFAITLFKKGKLSLSPNKMEDVSEVKTIIEKLEIAKIKK